MKINRLLTVVAPLCASAKLRFFLFCRLVPLALGFLPLATLSMVAAPAETNHAAIPFDQIGAVARKQYSGDGLAIAPTSDGAQLRCAFQRLDAHATAEGLWLTSTIAGATGAPFCHRYR